MKENGIVFNIQRYSLHDGSGLRTLVFMKGCPLKCLWCSNPEGIRPQPTLLFIAKKCYGCGRCADVCPSGAVVRTDKGIAWEREKCTECMACAKVCVSNARSICGTEYTPQKLAEIVSRDSLFYGTNGGVTVGGGEPLMQSEFVAEFLRVCKEEYGIHTAIETSSYAPWERAKAVFDHVDLFHMDIKHMDPVVHKELTGVSNELILANIRKTAETYDFSKRSMIIRVPVIPGLNSSEENIAATAEFVQKLGVVRRMELLPYHSLGAAKYERTKWTGAYQLSELGAMASDELMQERAELVRSYGLNVKIGG